MGQYRLYKPYRGAGAASLFEIAVKKNPKGFDDVMVFLQMAKEIPSNSENAAFGWKEEDKSVTVKLGDNDVAEFLAVIRGFKSEVGTGKGLYHQNSRGNVGVTFSFNQEKGNFFLAVSAKRGDVLTKISHTMTAGEALILGVLLEDFIRREYDWMNAVAPE